MGGILAQVLMRTYKHFEDQKSLKKMDIKLQEIVKAYCEYVDNHSDVDSNQEKIEYLKKMKNE